MKILANDGISPSGKEKLEAAGYTVVTEKVEQDQLVEVINTEKYTGLLVRSATKVRKDIIDGCNSLEFIGRGGVGMDNIDVDYARSKGLKVCNTPAASSQSVAELVMGHLFAISRGLHTSFHQMPENGASDFKKIKKALSKGVELNGKTIVIIGFGRIAQALASYALGCGMHVIGVNREKESVDIPVSLNGKTVQVPVEVVADLNAALSKADFISIHTPAQNDGSPVLGKAEFEVIKEGAFLVNAARGGVIDEDAMLEALNSGKLSAAGVDVFENEPTPRTDILKHDKVASSPHIGAGTKEAQDRIGVELADLIIDHFKQLA